MVRIARLRNALIVSASLLSSMMPDCNAFARQLPLLSDPVKQERARTHVVLLARRDVPLPHAPATLVRQARHEHEGEALVLGDERALDDEEAVDPRRNGVGLASFLVGLGLRDDVRQEGGVDEVALRDAAGAVRGGRVSPSCRGAQE